VPRIYEMKSNDYHSVKKSRKLQKHIGDHLQDLAAFAFLGSDGDTDEAVDSELRARAASEHKTSRSTLSSIVLNFEHELDEDNRLTSQSEGFLSEGKTVHDTQELSEVVKWDEVYDFKWELVGKPVEPEDDQNLKTFVDRFKSTISIPPSKQPPIESSLSEPDLSPSGATFPMDLANLDSEERYKRYVVALDFLDQSISKRQHDRNPIIFHNIDKDAQREINRLALIDEIKDVLDSWKAHLKDKVTWSRCAGSLQHGLYALSPFVKEIERAIQSTNLNSYGLICEGFFLVFMVYLILKYCSNLVAWRTGSSPRKYRTNCCHGGNLSPIRPYSYF